MHVKPVKLNINQMSKALFVGKDQATTVTTTVTVTEIAKIFGYIIDKVTIITLSNKGC